MMILLAIFVLSLVAAGGAMVHQHRAGVLAASLLLLAVIAIGLGPLAESIRVARESSVMETCRTLALAEFQYANDHQGNYPDGRSSTEVFQKLLDGNYVSDPAMFYLPMAGKTSTSSNRLMPENVCYDVTGGIKGLPPAGLPLVFMTGGQIDYRTGKFVRQHGPVPDFFGEARNWAQLLNLQPCLSIAVASYSEEGGMGAPKTDFLGERSPKSTELSGGWIGKTYRQLTPDGALN